MPFASYQADENFRLDLRADKHIQTCSMPHPLNASTTPTVYEPGFSIQGGATMRFGG